VIPEREEERRVRRASLGGSFLLPLSPLAATSARWSHERPARDVDAVEARVAKLETRVERLERTEVVS